MAGVTGNDVDDAYEAEIMAELKNEEAALRGSPAVAVDAVALGLMSEADLKSAIKRDSDLAAAGKQPENRVAIADHFYASQRIKGVAPVKKLYRVDGDPEPVEAVDKIEALAVHNERTKKQPAPRGRTVVEV